MDTALRRAALSWARGGEPAPQRLWPVLRELGGPEALFSSTLSELSERLGSRERAAAVLRAPEDAEADRWAAEIERGGLSCVTAFDSPYPRLLSEIADPPFVLFAAGSLERLERPSVAIVGSRGATRYGREVAERLARDLSESGVAIVSGFARGIDGAAHAAAVGRAGGTVAVLGCGLDVEYPREHAGLKDTIRRRDLLLSEFPPGTPPEPKNFPVRNRIIAGLSACVVVVEAARRSGSLITARLAADFGRDVFAVPASVFSPTSVGAHELLRDGAILCRGAEDVLRELFPSISPASTFAAPSDPRAPKLSADAARLLAVLRREGSCAAEELAQETELPAATVLAALFELEAAGAAMPDETGVYAPRQAER